MTVDDFLEAIGPVAAHTAAAYRSDLLMAERLVGKPLVTANEEDVQRLFQSFKGLKASTVRRRLLALRRYYSLAEARDLIEVDPTGNLEMPRVGKTVPAHLSPEQVDQLMGRLKPRSDREIRDYTLIKLLYYTGLRIGEAHELDLEDLLAENRQLRIRGRKTRLVPLNQTVYQALENWLDIRSRQRPQSTALFVSLGKGDRLSYGVIRQLVKDTLDKVGFGHVSPHQLRHTFATQLVVRGAPLEQISQLLGHSRIDTTVIYTKAQSAKLRNAVDLLG